VTYTALVIGELGPKHIALSNPEAIAIRVARPLTFVASAAAPLIWLLQPACSSACYMWPPRLERALTEDDIHYFVAEGG
jgi:putative hemolysin